MLQHLTTGENFSAAETHKILKAALTLKKDPHAKKYSGYLKDKTFALIFEKPSLRTRVTFETGIIQLGGHTIYLQSEDIKLGERETIEDVAKNLSRWVDGLIVRTYAHERLEALARNATIPVINALTDTYHPCQALACALTLLEHKKKLKGLRFAFIGDGNNVCHSILLLCAVLGIHIAIATPPQYQPRREIIQKAKQISFGKSEINIFQNPIQAVKKADIIYTDVWTSMGQEREHYKRIRAFRNFQINKRLLQYAPDGVLISHCLPAHRGEEITSEILDGPSSIALAEAENRLHTQKAVLLKLFHQRP